MSSKLKSVFAFLVLLAGLTATASAATGVRYQGVALQYTVDGRFITAPFATIRVCTEPAVGSECTPLANIFSDRALTIPLANPFTADATGYFGFYVNSGNYHVQQSGFTRLAGADIPNINLIDVDGSNTFAGDNLFTGHNTLSGLTTFSGNIASSGTNTFNGPNTFSGLTTFSAAATFNAAVNLNSGGVLVGTFTGSPTLSGNLTFSGAPVFSGNPIFNGNPVFNGDISSSGTNIFSGPNTFSGTFASTGTATFKNFENIRMADQYAGGTPAIKINAAVGSLSTDPGLVYIASNLGTGLWSAPPYNVAIIDSRFTNDPGVDEGLFPAAHSHLSMSFHAGANQTGMDTTAFGGQWGLSVSAYADAGGVGGDSSKANVVAIYGSATQTGLSVRPTWASAFTTNYIDTTNHSTAVEADLNNGGAADDTTIAGAAFRAVCGGAKTCGSVLEVTNSNAGDFWQHIINAQNYKEYGLRLKSGGARSAADILIIPPADDTNLAIILRNHADLANVFQVDDIGNITGASIKAGVSGTTIGDTRKLAQFNAKLVTTAAASDNVSMPGVTANSVCSVTSTNAAAATNIATTYISAYAPDQITVTHAVIANMNYDVLCAAH